MIEDSSNAGHQQGVLKVGACKERLGRPWIRFVAVIPCATVNGVHIQCFSRYHAKGEAAAGTFAVYGDIWLHAQHRRRSAWMGSETRYDLVEDQRHARLLGDRAQLF